MDTPQKEDACPLQVMQIEQAIFMALSKGQDIPDEVKNRARELGLELDIYQKMVDENPDMDFVIDCSMEWI